MTEIVVGVRALAQFCYRNGDIDHRFTASPTGAEGVQGHQRVYRRRPSSYQQEYSLQYRHQGDGQVLLLRGRADGYDPQQRLLEEIKTCRVPFTRIPDSLSRLHLAQARLYAAMLCLQEGLAEVEVRLTWFNIDSGEESALSQHYSQAELREFLEASLRRFACWLNALALRRQRRDLSLHSLQFPHGQFRPGQREMAELVYKCLDQGGQLLLEAPTGIGKTAAVLFPALKALATGKHEVIVFVTAKTVGRRAAELALAGIREAGYQGSALSLSARDDVCLAPGKACHGDDCPYAKGYYDKLPRALEAAIGAPALGQAELVALAGEFQVCPYQLALDLVPWMDLIIADQHYVYSLTAVLGAAGPGEERRWTALLDEAHNLPGRARGMYRAELAKAALLRAGRKAPPTLKQSLDRLNRIFLALQKGDWEEPGFASQERLPAKLMSSLQRFSALVGEQLAAQPLLLQRQPELMDFYFEVLQFQRVAENWGDEFRFEMTCGEDRQSLRLVLNCLDPARLLSQRQQRLHALVAFSATLSPPSWCRDALGMAPDAVCSRQTSPFAAGQLQVFLATGVDTRYRERAASLGALVALLRQWLSQEPGNCIVYFPSYRYLDDAVAALGDVSGAPARRHWWVQGPGAGKAAREELLALLEQRRDVVAFCILGGVFGEGVDLPGDQLATVVVVGVGLPQFNRDTERLRAWHQARHGDGFAYAYLYPGMQKVDQALGRVIRRMEDRGRALLVDSRYREPRYRELLPPWWSYQPWREN